LLDGPMAHGNDAFVVAARGLRLLPETVQDIDRFVETDDI
jgi:hypothetical protein